MIKLAHQINTLIRAQCRKLTNLANLTKLDKLAKAILLSTVVTFSNTAFSQTQLACQFGADYLGEKRLNSISSRTILASSVNTNKAVSTALSSELERAVQHPIHSASTQPTKTNTDSLLKAAVFSPQRGYWSSRTVTQDIELRSHRLAELAIAVVVTQLMEEKQLLPHDSLERWFPKVANAPLITINHLLTHTSGINNAIEAEETAEENAAKTNAYTFCPGTQLGLGSTGHAILASIAEQLDQEPIQKIVDRRIQQTLGLSKFELVYHKATASYSATTSKTDAMRFLSAYLRGELISDSMVNDSLKYVYPIPTTPREPSQTPQENTSLISSSIISPLTLPSTSYKTIGMGRSIMLARDDSTKQAEWVGLEEESPDGSISIIFDLHRKIYLVMLSGNKTSANELRQRLMMSFDAATLDANLQ